MRVLYVGSEKGTSGHRAKALQRLGHDVSIFDPSNLLRSSRLLGAWTFKTGGLLIADIVRHSILKFTANKLYDLVWVDGGELVNADLVASLRNRFGTVINYNVDDPFGNRDGRRWRQYLEAIPEYNLLVVVRECNVTEAFDCGAREVVRVFRSADEVAHAPRLLSAADLLLWSSEAAFIGTWMPGRGQFAHELIQRGVPLAIFGDRWQRAPEWHEIRCCWRRAGLDANEEYARAVSGAKVCIGLLSDGNRDLHTTRSAEIPYLGSLFLGLRTDEHTTMYREDEEAIFWATAEDCAKKCLALLANDTQRIAIAQAGRRRSILGGYRNEVVLKNILARL